MLIPEIVPSRRAPRSCSCRARRREGHGGATRDVGQRPARWIAIDAGDVCRRL